MSFPHSRRLPLAIAATAACLSAHAGGYTSPDGKFSLSGFGTLGAVKSDNGDVLFHYPGQGGGADDKINFDIDSKVAVQGTYKFTPTVSATTQIMTKYNAEGEYVPNIDWAFAKWQALPSLSVRAGRMAAPFFMVSDFREVGYANTFVRPPLDVYGQVFFSSVDGADVSYQKSIGSATVTAQLWTGDSTSKFGTPLPDGTKSLADVDLKRIIGLNLVAEFEEGFTLRAGHAKGKMTIDVDSYTRVINGAAALSRGLALASTNSSLSPLQRAGLQAASTQYGAVSSAIAVDEVDASFDGIGFSVDRDNWVGSLEYTKRKTDSQVVDSTGWYATVGYRFGKFTPYVGLSRLSVDRKNSNPISAAADAAAQNVAAQGAALTVAAAGGGAAAQAAAAAQGRATAAQVNAGVERILTGQDYGQSTKTIGVRWDAFSSAAIKAQWDQIKPDGANGMFVGVNPNYKGKAVNVISLAVDFVF